MLNYGRTILSRFRRVVLERLSGWEAEAARTWTCEKKLVPDLDELFFGGSDPVGFLWVFELLRCNLRGMIIYVNLCKSTVTQGGR
jgi:hypothetical protein